MRTIEDIKNKKFDINNSLFELIRNKLNEGKDDDLNYIYYNHPGFSNFYETFIKQDSKNNNAEDMLKMLKEIIRNSLEISCLLNRKKANKEKSNMNNLEIIITKEIMKKALASDEDVTVKVDRNNISIKQKEETNDKLKNNKRKRLKSYYYLSSGDILDGYDEYDNIDDYNFLTGNYQPTKELIKQYKKYKEITGKIYAIAEELGIPSEEDWENYNIGKYNLTYDFSNKTIIIYEAKNYSQSSSICCLKGDEFLEKCIEEIGGSNLEWYLKNTNNFF